MWEPCVSLARFSTRSTRSSLSRLFLEPARADGIVQAMRVAETAFPIALLALAGCPSDGSEFASDVPASSTAPSHDGASTDSSDTSTSGTGTETTVPSESGDGDGDGDAEFCPFSPPLIIEGPDELSGFGGALAVADFNGDGAADMAVGAHSLGPAREGGVFLYLSSSGTLPAQGQRIAGDIPGGGAGLAIAAGDVTGDGRPDLVVGAPGNSPYTPTPTGSVAIYENLGGADFALSRRIDRGAASNQLGFSLAIGEVNGDGFNDLVVGVRQYSDDLGAAFVYLSSSGGELGSDPVILPGDFPGEYAGHAVAVHTLPSGQPGTMAYSSTHRRGFLGGAWVVPGSSTLPFDSPSVVDYSETNDALQGYSLAFVPSSVGPLLALGAPSAVPAGKPGDSWGAVFVWAPDQAGTYEGEPLLLEGPKTRSATGISLAVGDVNGDGLSDLAAGMPQYNDDVGLPGKGAVEFFLGDGLGGFTRADFRVRGATDRMFLGTALQIADVNGDGRDDLVVTAPQDTLNSESSRGEVRVYFGGHDACP